MKKLLLLCLVLLCAGCQSQVEEEVLPQEEVSQEVVQEVSQEDTSSDRILVAYFTRVGNTDFPSNVDASSSASLINENGELIGNTEYIANVIVEETDGDKFLIETETKYPADYDQLVDQEQGQRDQNSRPTLVSHVENFDEYDTIYLGFPNWWYSMPMPVYSFLEEYDFSGKTIIPFNTSGSSGFSDAISEIERLCPEATVLEGYTVNGSQVQNSHDDIVAWINEVNQ